MLKSMLSMSESENKGKPEETNCNESVGSPGMPFVGMPGWFHIAYLHEVKRIEKPAVKQEDPIGCAVACVAFVLNIPYSEALALFPDGQRRVKEEANFYCPEIVEILKSKGLHYSWQELKKEQKEEAFKDYSIVFVKRSSQYPYGHFLCKYNNQWMDPWINYPNTKIEAGYKDELPEKPIYLIEFTPMFRQE